MWVGLNGNLVTVTGIYVHVVGDSVCGACVLCCVELSVWVWVGGNRMGTSACVLCCVVCVSVGGCGWVWVGWKSHGNLGVTVTSGLLLRPIADADNQQPRQVAMAMRAALRVTSKS